MVGTKIPINNETAQMVQPTTSHPVLSDEEYMDAEDSLVPVSTKPQKRSLNLDFADNFDFELLPAPSHFKKYAWKNNESPDNHRQLQNSLSGTRIKLSKDGKQFIAGVWEDARLIELTSSQLTYPGGTNWTLYVRKQNDSYLLTFDEMNFVARVKISLLNSLDTSKPFADITKDILEKISVVNILEDNLLNQKNVNYDNFVKLWENIGNQIANKFESAQDFLQVSLILEKYRHKRSKPSNSQLLEDFNKSQILSKTVKNAAKELFESEKVLLERNANFLKFDDGTRDLLKDLDQVYKDGIINHRKSLLSRCPSYGSQLSHKIISKLHEITNHQILYLSGKDITLFADLIDATSRFKDPIATFVNILWQKLLHRLDTVTKLEPLTSATFSYLCKSFLGIVTQISERTDISAEDLIPLDGREQWSLKNKISWSSTSALTYSLERQYRFIFKLMKHFEPGTYSEQTPFEYKPQDEILSVEATENTRKWYQVLGDATKQAFNYVTGRVDSNSFELKDISEERKIWLYLLHDSILSILTYQSSQPGFSEESKLRFQELTNSLMTCYTEFLQEAVEDRFESFRIAAHSIIRFIAQISPYLFKVNSELTIDQSILKKQTAVIRKMIFESHENDNFADQFISLIDAYSDYWECRGSIVLTISERFSSTRFEAKMKTIFEKLLKIVDTALGKEVGMQVQVNFFRAFNEFLKLLKGIEFEWLVKKNDIPGGVSDDVVKLVNRDKESYQVLNLQKFIDICNSPPEHYLIEVVDDLLDIINRFLNAGNWTNDVRIIATSDLLLAIGHSFLHFKEQVTYVSYEQFQIDSTNPFENVTSNNVTYKDFKTRLGNVENFYLYTRKQNEIDIDKALILFRQEVSNASQSGFDANYNPSALKESYNKYEQEFNDYIDWSEQAIIDDIQKKLKKNVFLAIGEWTSDFKQNVLASLLATLAAVWSKQTSKDVASTGNCLKPHCIQILCILRLLSADKSNGVDKHLAQVLTGQGKSIVLGLLSALLALTGYKVRVVCYSDYLASRDQQDFKDFFKTFGIDDKITYGTFDDMANDLIKIEINGQKEGLRTLVQNLVHNKLQNQSGESKNSDVSKTILLVDEVDVFFTEEFYGSTYNPAGTTSMQALVNIQTKIWKLVEGGAHVEKTVIDKIKEQINEIIRNNEDKEFIRFVETTGTFFEKHLQKMVKNAIAVAGGNESDWFFKGFKINEDGLICKILSSGLFSTYTYNDYYNIFNYFRLKKENFDHKNLKNFGYLLLDCGSISYAELPNEYPVILGVSGTLTTLNSTEKEAVKSYGIHQISSMPSFFGRNKLEFNEHSDFTLLEAEDGWLREIFNHIDSKVQSGRAVLVFFDTETEINKFKTQYQSKINRLHVLTGNEKKSDMEWSINEAGVAQSVTLATKLMGRGVDFKSNDSSVEVKGGVHVIQTFFSLDEKEEVQIKGRTARKDNRGSYELVVYRKQLETIGCSKNSEGDLIGSYNELNSVRKLKVEQQRKNDTERIKKSNEKHVKTMNFLKSFANYSLDKRSKYFLEYPFVEETTT